MDHTGIIILASVIGSIFGTAMLVISYFLRKTMDRLEKVEALATKTKNAHDLLKNDHENKHESITEKFDDLKESIITLTKEIKELTSQIRK